MLLFNFPYRYLVQDVPWHATVLSPLTNAVRPTTAPTCSAVARAAPHLQPFVEPKQALPGVQPQIYCSVSTLSTSTKGGP